MPLTDLDVARDQRDDSLKSNPAQFFPQTYNVGGGDNTTPPKSDNINDLMGGLITPQSDDKVYANTPTYYQPKDVSDRYSHNLLGQNNEGINAELQSGTARAANSAFNFVSKFGAYVTQNAGFVLGAAPALLGGTVNIGNKLTGGEGKVVSEGNAVSLMTDNFIDKLADSWKEKTQEVAPIYKSDKYTNGNIWQKLGTSSWWLDDALDRASLTAAMIVPGMLEAKGLGAFGTIARAGEDIEATGFASKALKTIWDNPDLYPKLGKVLGNAVYKAAATDGVVDMVGTAAMNFRNAIKMAQNIELTTFNVIGQNGLNGRETQVGITKSLTEQRDQGYNNYTDTEIKDQAAHGAKLSFLYNLGPTLASSLIELPQIYASMKGGMNVLKKLTGSEPEILEALSTGAKLSAETVKPSLLSTIGKVVGTAVEHGQVESLQVAIDRYLHNSIAGNIKDGEVQKDTDNPLAGIGKEYINNFSDPNGQNNIALGTIQGALTSIFGRVYNGYKGQYTEQDKSNKTFLDQINTSLVNRRQFNGMTNMTEKDETGNIAYDENNKIKWDQSKLAQLGTSYIDQLKDLQDRSNALGNNDKTALEQMNFNSLKALAQDFFQDANGKEYLTNVLRYQAKQESKNPDRENDVENGIEITPEHILQENIQHVENLYKAYNAIEQRHAGFLNLDINYKDKTEIDVANKFTQDIKSVQYDSAADQIFYNSKLQKNLIELTQLGGNEKVETPTSPEEERINDILNENNFLNAYLQESKNIYKQSIDRNIINATWEKYKTKLTETKQKIEEIQKNAQINSDVEEGKTKGTISVNTSVGPKDIQIGEEYYLGNTQKDNGTLGFPILTVLGKGDVEGTIKIKDKNGIRDISEKELEKYKLGKVADVEKSENSSYYFRNVIKQPNNEFFWNLGKKNKSKEFPDGIIPGTLNYDRTTDKLSFSYIQNGKQKSKEVGIDMLTPKEGFTQGVFYSKNKATGKINELTVEDKKNIKDRETSGKTQQDQRNRRGDRLNILSNLYDDLYKKHVEINNFLKTKHNDLHNINVGLGLVKEDIESENLVDKRYKGFKIKLHGREYLKATIKLSRAKDQIEKEIANMQSQQEETLNTMAYISQMIEDVDSLPTEGKELLNELKNELDVLNDLDKTTTEQISGLHKLIDSISKTIGLAMDALHDFISEFQAKYPKTDMLGFGHVWTDFLKANPNFLKLQPNFMEDLRTLEDLIDETEELEINPNEAKLKELSDQLLYLEKELKQNQLNASAVDTIYERFKEIANKAKKEKVQEKKIVNNSKKVIDSFTDQIVPEHSRPPYEIENKKNDFNVVNSGKTNINNTDHQKRTDVFGRLWNKLKPEERKKFKTIDITQATEEQIGLKELMEHLLKTETNTYKRNLIVARVIVNSNGKLVDQNGNEITENPLDNALYQVMPQPNDQGHLTANYSGKKNDSETMFRSTTSDLVRKNLEEQYIKQRNDILGTKENPNTTLQAPKDFYISFGSPIYDYVLDDKGEIKKNSNGKPIINYDTRTSVEDAGIMSSEGMTSARILEVVTLSEEKHEGTVSMHVPKGYTILRIPGSGLIKVFSRLLNNKESTTIYDVLSQLTKDLESDSIDESKLKTTFDWLKSILYWGIIKDNKGDQIIGKTNNVYFKNITDDKGVVTPTLFIGEDNYTFTPQGLVESKESIINSLQKIYHNIDAKLVNNEDYNKSYNEIIGVNHDGSLKATQWNNYQTYLLSNKTADNKEKRNDVPLTTPLKAVKYDGDINKKDFYITTANDADDAIHSTLTEEDLNKTKSLTPLKENKKEAEKPISFNTKVPAQESSDKFKLDGHTVNKVTLKNGAIINFKMDKNTIKIDDAGNNIMSIDFKEDAENQKVFDNLSTTLGSRENAIQAVEKRIVYEIVNQITAEKTKIEPAIEEKKQEIDKTDPFFNKVDKPDDIPYRMELAKLAKRFSPENWSDFETFLKTSFPNLPTYRVKNIIQRTNGKQAWGMLQKGAMYIYENAGIGTGYHEVFETVWKMFATPEEKTAVINEFRKSKGAYIDRFTNKEVNPSIINPSDEKYVSDSQIKEEIAEEFVDYRLDGKIPDRSVIGQIFHDLVNFIKTFFTGKDAVNNTQKLFDKIGNGYYKDYIPYETKLSYADTGIINIDHADPYNDSEFRDSKEIPGNQMNDIIQHLNYMTITSLIRNGESVFNIENISKNDLYNMLKEDLLKRVQYIGQLHIKNQEEGKITQQEATRKINDARDLYYNIIGDWENIVRTHIEYLKEKNITFDENELAILNVAEDNLDKTEYMESNKIDSFKQMDASVKLLLATLPILNPDGTTKKSTVGGVLCLPADQVNIQLLNELSTSTTPNDMFLKLGEYGIKNINYKVLYNRIIGTPYQEGSVNFNNVDKAKLEIISEFWKSYKKQSPDAITVFILPTGETVVSSTAIKGASDVLKRDMINSIIDKIKKGLNYFDYNSKDYTYKASETISNLTLSGNVNDYINFLNQLGIDFKPYKDQLTGKTLDDFKKIVIGIRDSFKSVDGIKLINTKTLDIDGRLKQLADLQATFEHPELESTYYNLSGDKVQTYMNPNVHSRFYNILSSITDLSELNTKKFRNFKYLLTDTFTKGSEILGRMFNTSGEKKSDTESTMHPAIINGISNGNTGKDTQVSKLSFKQRITQDLNLNLNGIYANLVPGDAALEAAITMHDVSNPFISSDNINFGQQYDIFKRYFLSEVNMSREEGRLVAKGRTNNSLRFFKDILDKDTYNKIMNDANLSSKELKLSSEDIYDKYSDKINSSIKTFFEQERDDMMSILVQYGILNVDKENKYSLENIPILKGKHVSLEEIKKEMYRMTLNFAIANIELHKLIYGDPYQYVLELKRTKLFGSPKQELLYNSDEINQVLDKVYNEGFEKGDIGWIDMNKEFFNTVTYNDVLSKADLPGYELCKETDGATIINLKTNKIFGIRTRNWSDDNERQYKYDMAYEKKVKNIPLTEEEQNLLDGENPDIADTYTPRKPSAAGNKESDRTYNSIVTDKTAQFVQSFRILHQLNPESNALELYNKMEKENIDYAIFLSGRKEGAEITHNLYENEKLNQTPYTNEKEIANPNLPQGIVKVPFSIFGVQMDVPSKDKAQTTEGSQLRALVIMDLIEGSIPLDFIPTNKNKRFDEWRNLSYDDKIKRSSLFEEMEYNRTILKAKQEQGYQTLLKKLGITTSDNGFIINDADKLTKTLKDEIFKHSINDNIIKSFKDFKNGTTLLETTPLYSQLRSIIYSIADKQVIKTKISGRQSVQAPSTLLESKRIKIEKVNGKDVYTSDILKFYINEDGKRVCQIAISRWFDSPLSDEQLLEYFKTDEGKKILSGIAFRIPTENKNSIDSYEIGFFLPKELRDQVVVPAAIVNKVGSDFDVDKLLVYLKNVFKDGQGNIKLIPFLGIGEIAKTKFGEMFDKGEFLGKKLFQQLQKEIRANREGDAPGFDFIKKVFGEAGMFTDDEIIQDFMEAVTTEGAREVMIDKLYKESLENEYIQSLQNLTSHPLNFDRLTSINSAKILEDLSDEIIEQTGQKKTDYSSVGNLIKRSFMAKLRQAFITGKQFIAIAAVNQKGHAQRQRILTYIDSDRKGISKKDKEWLGDSQIKFQQYNRAEVNGKMRAVFSLLKDAEGKNFISDINSAVIDGSVDISKDDWIIRLGIKTNTLSTWLLLIDLGVPIKTIGYFMNQPIINDFLRELEANDKKWLFDSRIYADKLSVYEPQQQEIEITEIPSEGDLFNMLKHNQIGKKSSDMTNIQKTQQQFILREFLKYAKIAEHSFYVTQGSNYDTATFNDPLLIDQKYWQLERARNTVISSVDDLINDSFAGDTKSHLDNIRKAFSEVLITDKTNTRNTLFETIRPYFKLGNKDFLRISHLAVNNLIDWAMQNDTGINKHLKEILLGTNNKKSSVDDIIAFRDKVLNDSSHPLYNNTILRSIKLQSGNRKDSIDNLYIQGRDGKSYNQNLIINGFEELKNELVNGNFQEQQLYRRFLHLAVTQSGLTVSPISFTSLLPYEDFKTIYNDSISSLNNRDLSNFNRGNVFERNNFNNNKIVPVVKALTKLVNSFTEGKRILNINEEFLDSKLQDAIKKEILPKLIERDTQSQYGDSDIIMYSYSENRTADQIAKLRKAGDYSYSHRVLMKRVYTEDEYGNIIPYIYTSKYKGKIYEKQLYKAINSWGDGIHATELYDKLNPYDENSTIGQPSVFENGIDKVQKKDGTTAEVEDKTILDILKGDVEKKDILKNKESSKLTPKEMNDLLNMEQKSSKINFQEEQSSGYRERTIKNTSADVTIAIAVDFNSAGEKLTKSSVLNQNKKYISVDANLLKVTPERVNMIVNQLNSINKPADLFSNGITLNIAGNGIYTMKGKYTQEQIDTFTYDLIKQINESPNLKNKIQSIRTGGQTGFDEAGAKAGIKLGIPTMILAPKGYTFRNIKGQDISSEKLFKERFENLTHTLKNGKSYTLDQIDSKMLEQMGYSPNDIGKMLKLIC